MEKICLPPIRVPYSKCICYNHQILDRSLFDNHYPHQNQYSDRQNIDPCDEKSFLSNSSVWQRLYRTPTGSSYRHSRDYNEVDPPKNDLDFRLRTCYDHAQETFAPKARIVVQPMTICHEKKPLNSFQTTIYPFKIVNNSRKEHFNEATKGQHIGSDHFANGKHGYSRVVAGAIPVD